MEYPDESQVLQSIPVEDEPAYVPPAANAAPNGGASDPTLDFADETLEFDPEASAFTRAAPPPESLAPYRAKLTLGPKGLTTVNDPVAKKILYTMAQVRVELIADKTGSDAFKGTRKDNPYTFDNATSMLFGGTSRIRGILVEALKQTIGNPTHRGQGEAILRALASEPQCRVTIRWKARCENCSVKKTATTPKKDVQLLGERNFPQKADKSHIPVWQCKECKADIPAVWEVVAYLPA